MLSVPFLAEKMFKQILNKGTINVFQGGGSAEYGQRPYFHHFFWDPSLSNFAVFNKPVIVDLEFKYGSTY